MNEPQHDIPEMHDNAVRDARMTGVPPRPLVSWAIAMGLGGLFLGYVGATDSYQLPLVLRLGLWLGLCAVAGLFGVAIEAALGRYGLRGKSPLVWWAALSLALAIAMVPVIFLVNSTGSSPQFAYLPLFAINSLAISAVLTALRLAIGALMSQGTPAPTANGAAARAPLLRRLPVAMQEAELLAIKSEGHYVQVYTSLGQHMLLMRLNDAMEEAQASEGLQVHRSWWVARNAIRGLNKSDGKWEAQIADDLLVPISRSYRDAIKQAGWS